ncbi:MAG: hypothetical protein K9G64_05480 [Bacteroidia bacterium]|nr:hypothetical protein [Bacteroidia bacterium]
MKNILLVIATFITLNGFAQREHPTLTKMKAGYYLYLDNGLEQIDLFKKIDVSRNFFKVGNARLVLAPKIGPYARKNCLTGFSLLLKNANISEPDGKTKNTFAIKGNFFGKECNQAISILPKGSVLTFTEIDLTITDLDGPNLQGVRPKKPGQLPIGFTVYIND